jgi:serine/threonine protein kinase
VQLLLRFLEVDPHVRITSTEALNHPFFSQSEGILSISQPRREYSSRMKLNSLVQPEENLSDDDDEDSCVPLVPCFSVVGGRLMGVRHGYLPKPFKTGYTMFQHLSTKLLRTGAFSNQLSQVQDTQKNIEKPTIIVGDNEEVLDCNYP